LVFNPRFLDTILG